MAQLVIFVIASRGYLIWGRERYRCERRLSHASREHAWPFSIVGTMRLRLNLREDDSADPSQAVMKRVVLDLDGKALVVRIVIGPLVRAHDFNTPSSSRQMS
jgi:hypothetical protein